VTEHSSWIVIDLAEDIEEVAALPDVQRMRRDCAEGWDIPRQHRSGKCAECEKHRCPTAGCV